MHFTAMKKSRELGDLVIFFLFFFMDSAFKEAKRK